ncbi:MAG: S9 family peptidase [bacterium]
MAKSSTIRPRKRLIKTDDLFNLRLPTAVAISPDESRVAYTVERMDSKENKYFSNIRVYDLGSDIETRFTHGNHNDGAPVWSPDGQTIAFVSTRDKKTGIYLMPTGGGAERQLIEIDGAIDNLQWTPNQERLVFTLRYNDSHFIEDEKEKKKPPVCRHITEIHYRLDGFGYLPQDTFQVYTLDVKTAELHKLTRGKRDAWMPAVSPDGKWLAFISNRHVDRHLNWLYLDLFVMPLSGGKERKVPTPRGPVFAPTFSPDSKSIAYLGNDRPKDDWGVANIHVWSVGLSGRPAAKDLMPSFDRSAYDQTISDTGEVGGSFGIRFSHDGKRIYFLGSENGRTNLFYVPAKGGRPTRVFNGDCHTKGFSLGSRTQTAALIHSDLNSPGEIMTCPTSYGAEKKARQLTTLNSFLQSEVELARTREVWLKSFDGTEVQGWLVQPPRFSGKKKYPALLEIHGGPRVQYGFTFFHEMQWLAAQGYVVLYTNPRGGAGRGELWAEAIRGGWGELDYKDCMAAADYLEKLKYVSPKRMGVTGGSYGGYMTNWIIGHTDRFAAAVTQRSVVDLKSFVGSGDSGYALAREFDGWPWTNRENYDKCSPITYFKNVKTPLLIIHSEGDLRCNIEQAEQMFIMLKVLKKKVEMVRFPEEFHGLSRHGRPDRRQARLRWIAKWFGKYL